MEIKMKRITDVKKAYDELRTERLRQGKFMLKPTEKGYWGISIIDDLHEAFSAINLGRAKSFVDLGSGDGRVVLAASLFTEATGIEHDQELMQLSTIMKNKLGLPAVFLCDDYLQLDVSKFDVLFIHPDNDFRKLETKLLMEMKRDAKLVVYNNIYLPASLKLEKKMNINGTDISVFRKP